MTNYKSPPNQSKGILDDFAVRKNVATREGTIEKVPVNNSDIANKKYVDDNVFSKSHDDLTNVTASQHHTKYTDAEADARVDLKIEDGTASGQMAFWNGTKWVKTETSELFWDDVNKRFGIKNSAPISRVDGVGVLTFKNEDTGHYSSVASFTHAREDWELTINRRYHGSVIGIQSFNANVGVTAQGDGKDVVLQTHSGDIQIFPQGSGITPQYNLFKSNGNVGIGTRFPATSAKLDLTSTTGALLLTRMTTAQRDALTAVNGMILYNTTLNKVQVYEGGAWASVI